MEASRFLPPFLLASLLVLGLLAMLPSGQAVASMDPAQGNTLGSAPKGIGWTGTTSNQGFIDNTRFDSSPQSLFWEGSGTGRGTAQLPKYFESSPVAFGNICPGTDSDGTTLIAWDFNFDTIATGVTIGFDSGSDTPVITQNPMVFLEVNPSGVPSLHVNSDTVDNSASGGFPLAPVLEADTWYHAELTQGRCDFQANGAGTADDELTYSNLCLSGGALSGTNCAFGYGSTDLNAAGGGLDTFFVSSQTGGTPPDVWIDDLSGSTFDIGVSTGPRNFFCSDIGTLNFGGDPNADYGYNYVEDVDTEVQGVGYGDSEFADGFHFSGDSGDFAYMGKSWTPGTRGLQAYFRIEASVDGQDSVFRTAFSEVSGTASATTKGNGINTQHFGSHLAVRFTEVGNDWRINLEEVQTSGGSTSELGGAFLGFNPNTPTTFFLTVDTRSGRNYVNVGSLDSDGDPTVILNQTLSSFWTDDLLLSQWYVGQDVDGGVNAHTFLDDHDNGQGDFSTCLYDLTTAGSAATGSQGTTDTEVPGASETSTSTTTCASVVCVDETSVPEGFSVSGFNGFLGLIMVGMIVAGGTQVIYGEGTGRGVGIVIAVFVFLGYMIGLFLGLLPIWPLVVLALGAIGLIILRARSG